MGVVDFGIAYLMISNSSLEIKCKESLHISKIVRQLHINTKYDSLQSNEVASYLEYIAHLTCRFIRCAMAEEDVSNKTAVYD